METLHAYDNRPDKPDHTSKSDSPAIGKANFYADSSWSFKKVLLTFGCGGLAVVILVMWLAGVLVQSGLLK